MVRKCSSDLIIKIIKLTNFFIGHILFSNRKKRSIPRCVNKIIVVDYALLGDSVMTIPMLRILRKNYPEATIDIVSNSISKILLGHQNLFNNFYVLNNDSLGSIKKIFVNLYKILKLVKKIRRDEYDIAIETRGDIRYLLLMSFFKSSCRVSFDLYNAGYLLDISCKQDYKQNHLIDEKLKLLQSIGCKYSEKDKYPKINLFSNQIRQNTKYKINNNLVNKLIIGIHPGASMKSRCWPYFTDLIKMLNIKYNNCAFLIFQGPNESEVVRDVVQTLDNSINFMIIETDLLNYIQIMGLCDCLICNDSSAGHIAAALDVKTFVIMGPMPTEYVKPYGRYVYTISNDNLTCKPCYSKVCLTGKNKCLRDITVEDVFKVFFENQKELVI